MRTVRLSRRTLLMTSVIGATALMLPAVTLSRSDLLRDILRRLLGPFEMADPEFTRFVEDLDRQIGLPSALESDVLQGLELLPDGIGEFIPAGIAERRERLERQLMTEFMLATGLNELPAGRQLSYSGLFGTMACNNPFARLI